MTEFSRVTISDQISRRYDRTHFIVLLSLVILLGLYIVLAIHFKPHFAIMLVSALTISGLMVFVIMRNPLGILTLRMQKRLGTKEIIFDSEGFTVITLRGEHCRFESVQSELFYIPRNGQHDYYLQIKRADGKAYSFYVGAQYDEIKALNHALEQNPARG